MENQHLSPIEGITTALNVLSSYLNSYYNTYYESITTTLNVVANKFAEIAQSMGKWSRQYSAVQKLADNQYVYWDYLDDKTIEIILNSENMNKTLREMNEKCNFKITKEIVNKCLESSYIEPYSKLFFQSINAFENGNCELSVLGLISIIDGLLSDVSNNDTVKIFKRADYIIKKIEDDEDIEDDEISVFMLVMTFRGTMESFSDNSDFSKKEPKNLNRHWIAHGRSRKRRTKLDCIKMIRFIYGIILIDEFSRKETELYNG